LVAADAPTITSAMSTARAVLRKLGTLSGATTPHFSAAATQCGATIHGTTTAHQTIARCWNSGQTPRVTINSICAGVNDRGLSSCVTIRSTTVARNSQCPPPGSLKLSGCHSSKVARFGLLPNDAIFR
jgi:hypothetical protein